MRNSYGCYIYFQSLLQQKMDHRLVQESWTLWILTLLYFLSNQKDQTAKFSPSGTETFVKRRINYELSFIRVGLLYFYKPTLFLKDKGYVYTTSKMLQILTTDNLFLLSPNNW